jgi:hypothetical protein
MGRPWRPRVGTMGGDRRSGAATTRMRFPSGPPPADDTVIVSAERQAVNWRARYSANHHGKTTSVEIAAQSRPAGGEGDRYVVGDRQ